MAQFLYPLPNVTQWYKVYQWHVCTYTYTYIHGAVIN